MIPQSPLVSKLVVAPKVAPVARSAYASLLRRMTTALPILGVGAGALLALQGKSNAARGIGRTLVATSAALGFVRWQLARYFTEEAAYQSEGFIGELEFRVYARAVRAETLVEGASWKTSLNEGFHRLAGYIFGENVRGTKIAMTAPVMATTGRAFHHADRRISFLMPGDRPLTTLPMPDDSRVKLREIPAHRVAVLRFRGSYNSDLPVIKRRELLTLVESSGLVPLGEVFFAGYDAPSTLPFLRRNEMLVQISTPN